MKNKSLILSISFILFFGNLMYSQSINITKNDGSVQEVSYNNKTIGNRDIRINADAFIKYSEITTIKTDHFVAYDKAIRKINAKDYPNLKIEFTGDQNVYALQLEELQKRRTGADITRAAGGIMTIIGVLSGDRQLTAAGVATNGIGTIARDINTDKTNQTQTAMLNDLDKKSKEKAPEKTEDELLREEYGSENVDGLDALIDNNHQKALAFANVGELSDDANYRLSAIWLKAMIATDKNDEEQAEKEYERLVTFDPEIKDTKEAKKETAYLLLEVAKYRN